MTYGHCGQPLRDYIHKKKNLRYYKCKTKACSNNKSAITLNGFLQRVVHAFKIERAKDVNE